MHSAVPSEERGHSNNMWHSKGKKAMFSIKWKLSRYTGGSGFEPVLPNDTGRGGQK
jgi:hypothetical protein